MSNQNVMARSTYLSDNLTPEQIELMFLLDRYKLFDPQGQERGEFVSDWK